MIGVKGGNEEYPGYDAGSLNRTMIGLKVVIWRHWNGSIVSLNRTMVGLKDANASHDHVC